MIESLTQAQIDRLPEFREKWDKIGLCTAPANRREAEEAIRQSYSLAGLSHPEIVWCGSPLSIIQAVIKDKYLLGKSVKNSVVTSVKDSVRDFVKDSIGGLAWMVVRGFVRVSFRDTIWNFIRNSVANSVWDFASQSQRVFIWDYIGRLYYGQHDTTWLSIYDYFREAVGLREETEKAAGLIEIAKHVGWWSPYEKICFVSERHNFLSLDARGRLHSLSGPAITYPDGWKIYVVHGITVPSWIVEDKPSITVDKIESEANAEVRRVMTEIYGHERYIRDSGAELVAKDELGELYRKQIPGVEPLVMVRVINSTPEPDGTSKEYWLRVDPELRPLLTDANLGNPQAMTARNAIASTFGKYGEDYIPSQQT